MSSPSGLLRGRVVLLASVCLLTFSDLALASSRRPCDFHLKPVEAVTLKTLRDKNTENLRKEIALHPMPGFMYIEKEVKNEQVGLVGPRALQQMLGTDMTFVRTPAPNAPMDTAVNLHNEARSFPIHLDVQRNGVRTSTAVYASMPKTYTPKPNRKLVSAEDYPVVIVHLHGGGTPTATGKNAMSIGEALAPAGVPVIAMDLPGHGRATRKIDGFTTFKDQIEWIMSVVDKLVDPNVKIIVSGHSWGGQFTAYWRRLTRDPKYRWRLSRLITVSPPVDVSLGGDQKIAEEFERDFERNFTQYEKRSSAADFDFMKNSVRNGKTSTVGGLHATFSAMDYSMPPLTEADRRELIEEDSFSGEFDIITYVARELAAQKQWGGDMKILGRGMTWKGLQDTGHNVWDLFIEGTKIPFMYDWMKNRAFQVAGLQGPAADLNGGDQATKLMDQIFRNYSNFFLFRQFIQSHDEYVNAANMTDQERKDFGNRKVNYENYVRSSAAREANLKKEGDRRAVEAVEALRVSLGIKEPITVERAKEELLFPKLEDARRTEIQTYLTQVEQVEKDMESNESNPSEGPIAEKMKALNKIWDADVAALEQKYKKNLEAGGISNIKDYKGKLDELQARKDLTKPEEELRKALGNLHQTYVQKYREAQGRFGKLRDQEMAKLKRPEGVRDYKFAQRWLAADQTDTRRDALTAYINRIAGVEARAREAAAEDLQNLPGTHSPEAVDSAAKMRADIEAMEAFTYCPPDDADACALAARVLNPPVRASSPEVRAQSNVVFNQEALKLSKEREKVVRDLDARKGRLDALELVLKELTAERTQLAKQWDGAWRVKKDKDGKEFVDVTSPAVAAYNNEFEAKEKVYRQLYLDFEDSSRVWLRQLKDAGKLNEASVTNLPAELLAKRTKYYAAKDDFEAFRDKGDALRWSEAIAGKLSGVQNFAASEAAVKMWGKDAANPDYNSLVARIRRLEDVVEKLRQEASIRAQEISRAQWAYSQHMVEKGFKLPFVVQRVAIREALDMNYNDLVARLRTDTNLASAFRNTLDKWNAYLALLRTESQTKDAGNY